MKLRHTVAVCSIFLISTVVYGNDHPQTTRVEQLVLKSGETSNGKISRGTFTVFENRKARGGRKINLNVVVLHANGNQRQPDPVFFLAGGPGQGAAQLWRGFEDSWMRKNRDIVLVSQRGTDGDNRLQLPKANTKSDLQHYLEPIFDLETIPSAIEALSKKADLRMYSTPTAMDDLNDVRQALGYKKINIIGGSYGTRAALVYIRRHGDTVRTATLDGVAPIQFTNPLFHASGAQKALEKIFARVEGDDTYRRAFPNLRKKFDEILKRFDNGPIDVTATDPQSGKSATVKLSREAFTSSLRVQMYYMDTSQKVPVLIYRAHQGNFRPFVENAINRNRALKNSIALGMLLCVTAAEDIARISPDEIAKVTAGTFLGDVRVRRQMEVCKDWPKSELPVDFGQPVKSNVPTLILSGTLDPVTPPRWGNVVAKNFPNSLHIVAPAAHGVGGACIDKIQTEFLESGSVKNLDVSCVKKMKLPPLYLPKEFKR